MGASVKKLYVASALPGNQGTRRRRARRARGSRVQTEAAARFDGKVLLVAPESSKVNSGVPERSPTLGPSQPSESVRTVIRTPVNRGGTCKRLRLES
eukprot:592307-Prymnesium_polylepis.1